METSTTMPDPMAALRGLTLAEIDRRLCELNAERAQLVSLRRSFIARDRARRRADRALGHTTKGDSGHAR
jgi:hypothetical protein